MIKISKILRTQPLRSVHILKYHNIKTNKEVKVNSCRHSHAPKCVKMRFRMCGGGFGKSEISISTRKQNICEPNRTRNYFFIAISMSSGNLSIDGMAFSHAFNMFFVEVASGGMPLSGVYAKRKSLNNNFETVLRVYTNRYWTARPTRAMCPCCFSVKPDAKRHRRWSHNHISYNFIFFSTVCLLISGVNAEPCTCTQRKQVTDYS